MNRVQPKLLRRLHTTIDDAMDAAGLLSLGVVPEDEQVMLSANCGQPIILASRKGAAVAYLNIARRLMGRKFPSCISAESAAPFPSVLAPDKTLMQGPRFIRPWQ